MNNFMDTNYDKHEKVIITGGAGFIGSHLANELVGKGYEVHVVDNLYSGKRKDSLGEKVIFHKEDVRDYSALEKIFEHAVYVFHLAALPRVQYSIEHPGETNEVNVSGTLNVLKAAHKNKIKKVIYSASSSAYGDQPTLPLKEDMSADPKSPYGLQKYIGECYCRVFSDVYGLPTVSLRYFNVYGPGQDPNGAYALVIGKFLKQKKEGKPITITGDGEQTRDFTHISDVVCANILAAESSNVGKGEVINIGAGNNVSINRIAELIGGAIEHVEARIEPKHTCADTARALKLLGWTPTVSIEEGIKTCC